MKKNLNEFERLAQENIVSPEQIENIKKTIAPIADAFNFAAYIKYLLDMPQRKSKIPRYKQRQIDFLKKIPKSARREEVLKQNETLIATMCKENEDESKDS